MKQINCAVIMAVMVLSFSGVFLARNQSAAQSSPAVAAAPTLRILSPQEGAKLAQNFVQVRFELSSPGASPAVTPNFRLQLDGSDPVNISTSDYTFTGLAPGTHVINVQLVDANDTPVGPSSQVRFVIVRPGPAAFPADQGNQPQLVQAGFAQSGVRDLEGQELPSAGGALPLLSVIGFGVLLGGIASALKTR